MTREEEIKNQIAELQTELKSIKIQENLEQKETKNLEQKETIFSLLSRLGFEEIQSEPFVYSLVDRNVEFICTPNEFAFEIVNSITGDLVFSKYCYDYEALMDVIKNCPDVIVYEQTYVETVVTIDSNDLSEDRDNGYGVDVIDIVRLVGANVFHSRCCE